MIPYLYIFLILFSGSFSFSGFRPSTTVKVIDGFKTIESVFIPDQIMSLSDIGTLCVGSVAFYCAEHAQGKRIILANEIIDASNNQQLFVINKNRFVEAGALEVGDLLFKSNGAHVPIERVESHEDKQEYIDITIIPHHTYFVGNNEILAHNMVPVAIGFSFAFGSGTIQFTGVTLSTAIMGFIAAMKWGKDNGSNNNAGSSNGSFNFSPPGGGGDDEFKRKHPHGKYIDAPYHRKYACGRKSPRPSDGQFALDNSVQISTNSPRRIGISDGEIVILKQTRIGEYHGYAVDISELSREMRDVLIDNNLMTKSGKIKWNY